MSNQQEIDKSLKKAISVSYGNRDLSMGEITEQIAVMLLVPLLCL